LISYKLSKFTYVSALVAEKFTAVLHVSGILIYNIYLFRGATEISEILPQSCFSKLSN